jgi:hypothetical protein
MFELHAMIGYPLFPVAGLELLLGFILLRQDLKHSTVSRSVAIIAFFAAAFSLITGLMYVRASHGVEYNSYARANWIGWFTLPPALQFLYYLENERSRVARVIGLVLYPFWTIVLALSLFTDLIVTSQYTLIPFSNRPGPLENPLRFFGAFLAVWVIVKVISLRRKTSGFIKKELNYFFYGMLIFGGGAGFTAGILQLAGGQVLEPGLASYFSLPWVALSVFAIARYQLFDIRLILSRAIATVLLLVIFSALQAGLFLLFERALGHVASIFLSLTLIGFLFFGTPLSNRVQTLVSSIVLKDRYSHQDILRNATHAMATILNLDELLHHIVGTLQKSLRVAQASFYLRKTAGEHGLVRSFGADGQSSRPDPLPDALVRHILRSREPVIREIQESLPEEQAGLQMPCAGWVRISSSPSSTRRVFRAPLPSAPRATARRIRKRTSCSWRPWRDMLPLRSRTQRSFRRCCASTGPWRRAKENSARWRRPYPRRSSSIKAARSCMLTLQANSSPDSPGKSC